ncbi:MAG: hypothetical protein IMZ62_13600 [Chloroflexi bacterium]|nr:hypothetical protein [Chloroflexota bacterium]
MSSTATAATLTQTTLDDARFLIACPPDSEPLDLFPQPPSAAVNIIVHRTERPLW